jgi:hypothetical protein
MARRRHAREEDRYSHTVLGEQADALAALPDLSSDEPGRQQQPATGTDNVAATTATPRVESVPESAPDLLTHGRLYVASTRAGAGEKHGRTRREPQHVNAAESAVSGRFWPILATSDTAEKRQPPAGFEPATCDLQNRCSAN